MSDVAHSELEEVVARLVETYTPGEIFEDWDLGGLEGHAARSGRSGRRWRSSTRRLQPEQIIEILSEDALAAYGRREEEFGAG